MPAQMFVDYLDESLHSSQDRSEELCTQYLDVITKYLETAHTMYVQTHDTITSTYRQSNRNDYHTAQQSVHVFFWENNKNRDNILEEIQVL